MSLCDALAGWMVQFESTRADVLRMERTSWKQHEQKYKEGLIRVCLQMRWAREMWVMAHFDGMCKQFQVETTADLSCALRTCMAKGNSTVCVCVCWFPFQCEATLLWDGAQQGAP